MFVLLAGLPECWHDLGASSMEPFPQDRVYGAIPRRDYFSSPTLGLGVRPLYPNDT
jgi:hypothetical protein